MLRVREEGAPFSQSTEEKDQVYLPHHSHVRKVGTPFFQVHQTFERMSLTANSTLKKPPVSGLK